MLIGETMLNVALPKGRLGEKVYEMLSESGYPCPEMEKDSRKLTFENSECGVSYFWVKPSDVGIYVERGSADIGVLGKDILVEYMPDVYELVDLGIGKCKMCVASKKDFRDNTEKTLRVATKFPKIATEYYSGIDRDIDVIKLNGSIEIAPLLGLSDVIVDIVETGKTLKENNLEVIKNIMDISARFICNKVSYQFKNNEVIKMADALKRDRL